MQTSALHPTPSLRDVTVEQIRAVGATLRGALLAGLAVAGLATLLVVLEIAIDGRAVHFLPHQWILPGALGFLLPIGLWRGEKVFGASFLWTLPVDRRRHALTKVFAGWIWLMALVAGFVLLLLALALVSGGNILAEQTLLLLPAHLNPALTGSLDPAAVQTVRWSPTPLLWLVPFTGATATYLLASAAVLGVTLRGIIRGVVALVVLVMVVAAVGEVMRSQWLIFAPSRLTEAVLLEPYGLATLLTATPQLIPVDAVLPNGDVVIVGRGVPDPGRWGTATLLWLSAGLLAVRLAASRHRERRV